MVTYNRNFRAKGKYNRNVKINYKKSWWVFAIIIVASILAIALIT